MGRNKLIRKTADFLALIRIDGQIIRGIHAFLFQFESAFEMLFVPYWDEKNC